MSLLDDLRTLDVRQIVDARASLVAAVSTPELQALADGGPAAAMLGDLGKSLQALEHAFPGTDALLRPLTDALDDLVPQLDPGHLPIARYADAVREGATLASRVLGGFDEHPSDWGKSIGRSLGDALQIVGGTAGTIGNRLARSADAYAELIALVEHPPSDPRAIGRLALDVILPFPRSSLVALRDGARQLVEAADRIALPGGRTSGLVTAFDVVATAAASGDDLQLDAALRELDRARRQTVATLEDDLRFVAEQMARLQVGPALRPLAEASRLVRAGGTGVLEFMQDFRREIAEIRFQAEHLDAEPVRRFLRELPDLIEQQARQRLEAPVDRLVARTKEALRSLFRRLPVRQYRAEVTLFLHQVAERIEGAGLDAPASAARNALSDATAFLTSSDLQSKVQNEMQRLNIALGRVLDGIAGPLDTIATAVDELADRAASILDRATAALAEFQQAIDAVQQAIDGLGLHDVEQRIVEALQNLRQKAEDLLSRVPLPEQLRPQVEQLVETLRDVDFDELLGPVREVAGQIRIPDDVSDAVHGGLAEAKRVIENLIPQQLIESISGEVGAALDSIRAFDPASLVPNLASYLDEAASAIEKLDPRQLAEEIRGPYQAVLDLLDRVHPAVLLRPVIDVFDTLVDAIPAPSALPVAQSLGQALDGAGRVAGRALVEPAARLAPEAQPEVGDPSTPRPVEPPSAPADIRPGDAIRLLGYVPGKLREALRGIEASAVGDVVAEIDSCTGALARQLRGMAGALAAVESRVDHALGDLLAPVAAAQARAQLSIQANAAGASLTVRLDAVAAAGPDRIRHDLGAAIGAAGAVLRRTGNTAGGSLMQEIDRAAAVLESSPLASLLSDFDGLLATLDPEPIAADMDLAMAAVTARASTLLRDVAADLQSALLRLRAIVNELNPMALAQRFISVLEVLREEIDVLNPRRLASELAEIHTAIRQAIDAYDPRIIAEDLARVSREVAQQIRALNPQQLLGNLDFWQDTVDRVAELNPATRLAEVGAALLPVGERLAAIQIDGLIEAVNRLAPSLVDEFDALADAIRNEIIALLESLRYATGSASVSVSAEASVG